MKILHKEGHAITIWIYSDNNLPIKPMTIASDTITTIETILTEAFDKPVHDYQWSLTKIFMPPWVKLRQWPWKYAGVIDKNPVTSGPDRITTKDISFEELVQEELRSDHGKIREVDYYEQGAAIWWKETIKEVMSDVV